MSTGATANTNKILANKLHFDESGSFILSGCPAGGSNNTYSLIAEMYDSNDNKTNTAIDTGSGANITGSFKVLAYIRIMAGTIITNPIRFFPMIRPAGIRNKRFSPYPYTIKVSTQIIDTSSATDISNYTEASYFSENKVRTQIQFKSLITAGSSGVTIGSLLSVLVQCQIRKFTTLYDYDDGTKFAQLIVGNNANGVRAYGVVANHTYVADFEYYVY